MQNTAFETPRITGGVVKFQTKVSIGEFLPRIAKFEVRELKRVVNNDSATFITEDEMEQYLITLLWMRVNQVNGKNVGEHGKIYRKVRVPARWFVLLAHVGIAFDSERKFEFEPELVLPKTFKPVSADRMIEISYEMEEILQDGYVTVPGCPIDQSGSLEFMAKTKMQDVIVGMDKHNPLYGFLASILMNEVVSKTYDNLDLLFRVQYSTFDTYMSAFASYFVEATRNQQE